MEIEKAGDLNLKAEEIGFKKLKKEIWVGKFSPVPYADVLMSDYHFVYDKYKRFWRYDSKSGVWLEDAEEFIRNRLRDEIMGDEMQKKNYAEEVVSYIRDLHYNPNFKAQLDKNLIPFENCIFNIQTGEILNFSPEYFVTNKIPIKLNPEFFSECPEIDEFFSEIVGEKYKVILYELCAYCLYRGYPYQKLFFLIGAGQNGKSTFLELLQKFLGRDNVSGVSPQDFFKNRFALGHLWNKLANISSDISYEALKNVNRIKEVTGGDSVDIERKFKNPFRTKLYAKLIFSTNQIPIVHDKSLAWYRRVYLIEFPKIIKEPDPSILNKLTTEEELSGLAWKSCQILKYLSERGFVFTYDIDVKKVAEIYEDLSNPLHKFLRENTKEDPDGFIFKFEFRESFLDWLKRNKLRVWSEHEIGREMKSRYDEGKRTYYVEGAEPKQYRAWLGVKWVEKRQDIQDIHLFITSIYRYELNNKKVSFMDKVPFSSFLRFQALKPLNSLMILQDNKPKKISLEAGKSYDLYYLGDEAKKIAQILAQEEKIKPVQEKNAK